MLSLEDFSRGAALAAEWTRDVIRPETREFLLGLSPSGEAETVGLYHASPRDPIWEYVLSGLTAELCLDTARNDGHRVSLIGHSHVALSFHRPEGEPASGSTRRADDLLDLGTGEWLLNPGSTGQPRDGDPRAAWLVLDTQAWTAEWRRAEYDIAGAQAAIRAARLPGLARRAAAVRPVSRARDRLEAALAEPLASLARCRFAPRSSRPCSACSRSPAAARTTPR